MFRRSGVLNFAQRAMNTIGGAGRNKSGHDAHLASDSFTRGNGAIGITDGLGDAVSGGVGKTWLGANFTISSNKAITTPTLGSNVVVNGTFAADTNWTKDTGWTIALGVAVATGVLANAKISQANKLTLGLWYQVMMDIISISANGLAFYDGSAIAPLPLGATVGTKLWTLRAKATDPAIITQGGVVTGSVDNVVAQALTLASMISGIATAKTDIYARVKVTLTAGTQAGLISNLDSISAPANFLVCYHDGANLHLDKCVGGVYTSLIDTTVSYSAGAVLGLKTHLSGSSLLVDVLYNGAAVGTQQTVSDAGIVSNTIHGLFSAYVANSFQNFILDRYS